MAKGSTMTDDQYERVGKIAAGALVLGVALGILVTLMAFALAHLGWG